MSLQQLMGKRTKWDVTNRLGAVLVPAGKRLEQEHIHLMEQHRVDAFDVIIEAERGQATAAAKLSNRATEQSTDIFKRIAHSGHVPVGEIKGELLPIIREAAEQPDIFELFQAVKAKDEYTHRHNAAVGVLSTMIGRWMGLPEPELEQLALAATLHDVGKIRIPEHILNKPGKLTPDEFAEIKQHTVYGYHILQQTPGLDSRIARVALEHHERDDGNGYPHRKQEGQIDFFSKIVAVADIFHAMSSDRPYHKALPFHEVIREIRQGSFGALNPQVTTVFLDRIIRGLVGRKVKLSDGRTGETVHINPHDDTHPLVKVGPHFIDLSLQRELYIQEIML